MIQQQKRSHSVVVITFGSDPNNPGSSPGGTSFFLLSPDKRSMIMQMKSKEAPSECLNVQQSHWNKERIVRLIHTTLTCMKFFTRLDISRKTCLSAQRLIQWQVGGQRSALETRLSRLYISLNRCRHCLSSRMNSPSAWVQAFEVRF